MQKCVGEVTKERVFEGSLMLISLDFSPTRTDPTRGMGRNEAKKKKQDEFYTRLEDIENELEHYTKHFKDQIVYCNCDDPLESNFFIYFVKNFKRLGLKKLITTCYDGSPVVGTQLELGLPLEESGTGPKRVAYKIEVTDVADFSRTDKEINFWDVADALRNGSEKARLEKIEGDKEFRKSNRDGEMYIYGGGDFRSEACVKLLEEADIVVTNPPFSLFREYVPQIMEHKKKFLIIGNKNAITYEEVFPHIKDNKIWGGVTPMSTELLFFIPQRYIDAAIEEAAQQNKDKPSSIRKKDGIIYGRSTAVWFTNLDHEKRHQPLDLTEKYSSDKYPKFDGYDAIWVPTIKEIPSDYEGVMGVPVTFLGDYCPEQFDIVGCSYAHGRPSFWPPKTKMKPTIDGDDKYKYLFIRRKKTAPEKS